MSSETYIIDIDSLVLTGVDQRNPSRLSALIETEVRRALERTGLRTPAGVANNETRVAGEVARSVVRSVQRASNGV
jgi:hypothetical protein